MKIAPKAADGFLTRPQAYRGALLYGPDAGLARERAGRIARSVLGDGSDPMARVELSEAALLADPALLADELSAISMLAPKRVITVAAGGDRLTSLIEAALPFCNDHAFLLVVADELSGRSSLRALFEAHERLAALACYKDEPRDVQAVIRDVLGKAGIAIDREAADYLAAQLGNDRYVTYQELEKAVTYAGAGNTLTLSDVQALADYNRDLNLDDIVNAVADKDLAALDTLIAMALREGTQPIAYLRALQRYFNRLYKLKAQVAAGQNVQAAVNGLRPPVFFKHIPLLTRHIQQWSAAQIAQALQRLAAAELACKTSDIPMVAASTRQLFAAVRLRNA